MQTFLELVSNAPEQGSGSSSRPDTNTDITKDTPKSDEEKERVRTERETAAAREALVKFGSIRFMAALWTLIAMDDPDSIMLRFLRARKWNSNAASAMLAACIKWRLEFDVAAVVEKGEEGAKDTPGFLNQFRQGKTYTQGFDLYGRPVRTLSTLLKLRFRMHAGRLYQRQDS